jgi:hypothetical protein
MVDLQFTYTPSFALCMPLTDEGRDWVLNNLGDGVPGVEEEIPDCMWPVAIEHRYLADIVEGARADGLVCDG